MVESVRSRFFADSVDATLTQQILEIERQHMEDRPRAQESVARTIQQHLDGGAAE
ncbi:hypothetical protein [Kocuria rosea]|uniref:hypothetical protein n=1 Tax=Kocuria rosea TaxID=1275 RepID=UPI0016437AE9|nr:hypothetical protein [Kocuria rosea]